MSWQLSSYVAILFSISLLSVIVAYFALRLRDKPGGLPLGLLMLAVAVWSFTLAFEAKAATIPAKVLWSKFEYLGITSVPVLLLLFALEYTHRGKWLKRRYTIWYWTIPLISLVLAFTNEWHHLIWTSFTPIPGSNLIIYGHGTWFWIMVTYDYLVLSTATILLLRAAFQFRHVYRRQAIILFVGMFPPWLANILYVFNLSPPGWDLTPIGFALTGPLLTWSLARLQLLDLAPVARDKVIASMRDGMLVLDAQNRIVDINPAAQKLIGVDGESAIGRHAEAILAKWTGLEDCCRDSVEAEGEVFVDGVGYIEWRTLPLQRRGERPSGQLLILRNITERARAEEETKRRGEELETLQEISLAITAQLELTKLLQNIVERGCRLLDATAGCVYLVDEASGDLEFAISHGYTGDYTGTHLVPGEGLGGRVLQSGEPLAVDDYHRWEGRSPKWKDEPLTAILGLPLKRGGQVIGVLEFSGSDRAKKFDAHDLWLASLFANQAAIAIANAQLYRAAQAARESADTLRQISRAVGSTLELDQVLALILSQTKRVLAYDTASILLFAGGQPSMAAVSGYEDAELVKTEVTLRLGDSPILQALARDHHPVVIADVRQDERWIWVPGGEAVRAWLGAPLLARGEMIGALMIDSTQPGFYTDADVEIAQALAGQAAVALENARLYQAEQRGREVAEALQETARVVNASLDLEKVLPLILEQLAQVIEYDSSAVLLLDDGRFKVTAGRGFSDMEATLRISFSADEDTISAAVMRTRRPLILEDVQTDPRWRSGPETAHIHGWIGAPLIVRDRVIGLLTVDSRRPGAYSQEDGQLVFAFANQVAVAIENARLFEQAQQEIAERARAQEALDQRLIALTQPVGKVGDLKLTDIIDVRILQGLQDRFAESHDVASLIFDDQGKPITQPSNFSEFCKIIRATQKGRARCEISDANLSRLVADDSSAVAVCKNFEEILEGAVSIFVGHRRVATWAIGQKVTRELAETKLRSYAEEIGADVDQLVAAGKRLKTGSKEQFEQAISFLETMAGNISLLGLQNIQQAREITERKRAQEALQKAKDRIEALYYIGQMINSTLEVDAILDRLTDEAMRVTRATHGQVLVTQKETGRFERRSLRGFSPAEAKLARTVPLTLDQGINGRAYTTRQTVRVDDVQGEPGYFALLPATRTELAVPIVRGDQVLGNLDLQSPEAGAFRDADLGYLSALADQAAIAMQNANLHEQVQRHAAELEQRVDERTHELAGAYEQLQELDRLKSKFVTDVSHELRTPVANIKLYSYLLQHSKPEKRGQYLTIINEQSDRLANLIEDILNLSRLDLDLGETKVEFAPVDLNAVVEQIIAVYQPRAEAAGLELTFDPGSSLPPVRANSNQLSQLITNLVINAVNYTPAGQIRISTRLDAERGQACLQVQDTGMGIKPEDMPHLFERFYRGQGVGSSNIPGTGLGLSIVKEIVDLHGGEIKVESRVNEGSTFQVWLPLEK